MVHQMLTPLSNLTLSECQKQRVVESQIGIVQLGPSRLEDAICDQQRSSNTSSVVGTSSSFLKRKKKMLEEQMQIYYSEPVEEEPQIEDAIDTHYLVPRKEGPCKSSFTEFNHLQACLTEKKEDSERSSHHSVRRALPFNQGRDQRAANLSVDLRYHDRSLNQEDHRNARS